MFGPLDPKPTSGQYIVGVVRGLPGWMPGCTNVVDVRDVAKGMILAWRKGRHGERYILGGQNMTYKELFEQIAQQAGVKPPTRTVPWWLMRLIGLCGDVLMKFGSRGPLINSVAARWAFCRDYQFSSDKAKAELGYNPGPVEPALRDAVAWLRRAGMI
jgi:dihydroflavonol-4-reductase